MVKKLEGQGLALSGGSILAGFLAHRMLAGGSHRLDFDDWETESPRRSARS